MSVIETVRDFLLTCPLISEDAAGMYIEFADADPASFALTSNGINTLKTYVNGTRQVEHNFVLYAREFTVEDATRLENSEFLEDLDAWLWDKNISHQLPTGIDIITSANGMLYDVPEGGDTGLYQIQLKAIYTTGGTE